MQNLVLPVLLAIRPIEHTVPRFPGFALYQNLFKNWQLEFGYEAPSERRKNVMRSIVVKR